MHMADALISPAVGCAMWGATAGLTLYSAGKLKKNMDDRKMPLMGVMGAFVFAAQMINFTIPGTGSSGHLGGGLLLAILLGPDAAFLTMGSILTVQALFFADGGLLALGCNIFNLGFFPCFVAYPLVYRILLRDGLTRRRIFAATLLAGVLGVQMGAFGVVVETVLSGLSELPFSAFVLMMQPIHLAIGVVEGLVTAGVVLFIFKARPEVFDAASPAGRRTGASIRGLLVGLLAAALITGGALSWFASSNPDGLEWSVSRVLGKEPASGTGGFHAFLKKLQEKTAILPDYDFRKSGKEAASHEEAQPSVRPGASVSGIVGALTTMALVGLIGFIIKRRRSKQ